MLLGRLVHRLDRHLHPAGRAGQRVRRVVARLQHQAPGTAGETGYRPPCDEPDPAALDVLVLGGAHDHLRRVQQRRQREQGQRLERARGVVAAVRVAGGQDVAGAGVGHQPAVGGQAVRQRPARRRRRPPRGCPAPRRRPCCRPGPTPGAGGPGQGAVGVGADGSTVGRGRVRRSPGAAAASSASRPPAGPRPAARPAAVASWAATLGAAPSTARPRPNEAPGAVGDVRNDRISVRHGAGKRRSARLACPDRVRERVRLRWPGRMHEPAPTGTRPDTIGASPQRGDRLAPSADDEGRGAAAGRQPGPRGLCQRRGGRRRQPPAAAAARAARTSRSVSPTTPAAVATARSTTPPTPASRPPIDELGGEVHELSPERRRAPTAPSC